MGVAVRRYYRSPRTHDDYLESHLELWDRSDPANPKLLPGYGWIFGMGDGTSNVGLGILSTSRAYGSTDYRALLRSWLDGTPEEWGFREENAEGSGRRRRAADGVQPHTALPPGMLLVGDAGGLVNPFNGEGIAYAMESAAIASRCAIQSLARAAPPRRRRWRATRSAAAAGARRLLPHRQPVLPADRQPDDHGPRHPARPAPPHAHGVPAEALGQPVRPEDGATSDRVITAMARLAPSV
jgi:flavin-dependent dehydrogenase